MIVGLTGPSGAGKSEVATIFAKHGFYLIDADQIAHSIYYSEPRCVEELQRLFGNDIVSEGKVDRKRMAKIVFASPTALQQLNQTVLPYVVQKIQSKIEKSNSKKILLDAPLLFESGISEICRYSIGVLAPYSIRKARIVNRDHIDEKAADQRLLAQPNEDYYLRQCDMILWNDGTRRHLQTQVEQLLKNIFSEQEECQ